MFRSTTCALLACLSLGACDLIDGGGAGGGSKVNFSKGYVFVKRDDRNVYVADVADLTVSSPLSQRGNAKHPSLSPNGLQAVYVEAVGGLSQLMVVSTKGGEPSVLLESTANAKNFRNPVFSPDGKKVVFTYDDGSLSAVGLLNADGSGFTRVAGGTSMAYASPSFSPDGLKLLVAAGSSSALLTQLQSLELAKGRAQNVASSLGSEAKQIANRVVWSPDGKFAAFDATVAQGGTRIFVMDLSTQQVTQLTDHPGEENASDAFPTWVGTSEVAFSSDYGGADQVYALPKESVKTSGGLKLPSAMEPWFGPN